MDDCTCDLRTRLIGDGCRVCNPTLAIECADETIAELRAVNAELLEALEELLAMCERQVDFNDDGDGMAFDRSRAAISRARS